MVVKYTLCTPLHLKHMHVHAHVSELVKSCVILLTVAVASIHPDYVNVLVHVHEHVHVHVYVRSVRS